MAPAFSRRRDVGLGAALGLVILVSLVGGCRAKQRAPADEHAAPPKASTAAPTEAAVPVDRALPGELAEGTFQAFGLLLPRVMNVSARFDNVVFASADAPADQVANYVRQRVDADKIVTGPEKTVFSRATVKGSPGREVTIMVVSKNGRTDLEVRDVTLKPSKPDLSPDERWRELGLKPDGTPLDPTQLR